MESTLRSLFKSAFSTGLLVFLLCGFSLSEEMNAQSTEQNREILPEMTLSQLQNRFYKTEIEDEIFLELDDVLLETALREVARSTGLRLSYRSDIITDKKVSINGKSMRVSDALESLLNDTNLDYRFSQNGYLIISEKVETQSLQEVVSGRVLERLATHCPG